MTAETAEMGADLGDMVKIEQSPKLEGRQMTMVMSAK